jgi:hypothetical protein
VSPDKRTVANLKGRDGEGTPLNNLAANLRQVITQKKQAEFKELMKEFYAFGIRQSSML